PLGLERRERRQGGRLEDDGIAARERGSDLPRSDHEREVPRDDEADHAERLAEGHVYAPGDRDRVAEQPLRRAGVVAEGLDDHPDLPAGVAYRLARVSRLQRRAVVASLPESVGEAV